MRTSPEAARAQAEAFFKPRQPQIDVPPGMQEYQAAQRAALERMAQLRALRLAREAQRAQTT